jgi:hypothetical protein
MMLSGQFMTAANTHHPLKRRRFALQYPPNWQDLKKTPRTSFFYNSSLLTNILDV